MPNFDSASYKAPINKYPQAQCTWYAYGRIHELTGKKLNVTGNAATWYDQVSSSRQYDQPGKNRVAVWAGGPYGQGHVMVIENVFDDGSILFSDANYNGNNVLDSSDGALRSASSEDSMMNLFSDSFIFKGYITA